jgi:hypothetical protein
MTFHAVDVQTVEQVEAELVEEEANSMFTIGNIVKDKEVLT